MKALIKKDFMTSGLKLKYLFVFITIVYILFLLAPLDDYLPMAAYSLLLFAPIVFIFSIYNYTETDNYKSELILPVKRYMIVLSRYVTYLLISILCLFSIILLIYMKYLFGLGELLSYQVNLISVGVGVTLVFGGLVLFFVFLLGQKKMKSIGIVSFVLTLVPIRLYMELSKVLLNLQNVFDIYHHSQVILFFLVFSFLFFCISCLISTVIFKRKEF